MRRIGVVIALLVTMGVVAGQVQPPQPPPYQAVCPVNVPALVTANGLGVCGEKGPFHPLGITYFSGLRLQRYDRPANLRNFELLQQYRVNYVRILGMIDWPGLEIDPNWPDYESLLAQFIDDAYDYGIRTEITVVGGYARRDPILLTQRVIRVVTPRYWKVIALDAANERDVNNQFDKATAIRITQLLRAGLPNLVATSSELAPDVLAMTRAAGANFAVYHVPRVDGRMAGGWFNTVPMIQFGVPADNQEPVGPCSSIAQLTEPVQLAMQRAASIVGGTALYVFHVADGITSNERFEGRDCGRLLHTYFGDVPNFDAMMSAVHNVDKLLPVNVENWVYTPMAEFLVPDSYWSGWQVPARGVVYTHAVSSGDQWVATVAGVIGPVVLTATRPHISFTVYDPLTLEALDHVDLDIRQTYTLQGAANGMAGFILRGTF